MIEIRNVTKRFFNITALNNVSLDVQKGSILGVLGPNGSGKTTLFKLIAGFINPNAGAIRAVNGGWKTVGYKPERMLYPNKMKVKNLLRMSANLANVPPNQIEQTVRARLDQVGLSDAGEKRIKECSKGMRQRVGLAQALMGDPDLIILDEPSNGLDPEGQVEIQRVIRAIGDAGNTVLLSSHQLPEVTAVCTDIIILKQGQILYRNSMQAALAERPHVTIVLDKDAGAIRALLASLHPDIQQDGRVILLNNEAMKLRRQVLSLALNAGYDVVKLRQKQATLHEIYAEAVQS